MHGTIRPATEVRMENIPGEMLEAPRWMLWQPLMRDGKWTKVPFRIDDPNRRASSTDPSSWGECSAPPRGYGLGFALGDGWVGVDFDEVRAQMCEAEIMGWVHDQTSYAEWSVSKQGIHVIMRGVDVPEWAACRREGSPVEVYKGGRFFTVTGDTLHRNGIEADQNALNWLLGRWLDRKAVAAPRPVERLSGLPRGSLDPSAGDYALAAKLAERGVASHVAEAALRRSMEEQGRGEKAARHDYIPRTVERAYAAVGSGRGILGETRRDSEGVDATPLEPATLGARAGARQPEREVLVQGIARRGDVMNIIAAPKVGKSWLVQDLAVSMCGDASWLGRSLKPGGGRVLLVDNELHPQEGEPRLEEIAAHKGVPKSTIHDRLEVLWMRERGLQPLDAVERLLEASAGRWDLVVLDALYRFLPAGCDENSNSDIVQLYNRLDAMARVGGCLLAIVHHTSKGDQSGKATTDVGSGASSAARAADVHLALRPHEEEGAFVVSMALRTFREATPFVVRRQHPVFVVDDELDPEDLRRAGPKPKGSNCTPDDFANRFVNGRRSKGDTISYAMRQGLARRVAESLLAEGIESGRLHIIDAPAQGPGRRKQLVVDRDSEP